MFIGCQSFDIYIVIEHRVDWLFIKAILVFFPGLIVSSKFKRSHWIGLHNLNEEGVFHWLNETKKVRVNELEIKIYQSC